MGIHPLNAALLEEPALRLIDQQSISPRAGRRNGRCLRFAHGSSLGGGPEHRTVATPQHDRRFHPAAGHERKQRS
jgi:hypothetical protein